LAANSRKEPFSKTQTVWKNLMIIYVLLNIGVLSY
jgi:hypothetical protein